MELLPKINFYKIWLVYFSKAQGSAQAMFKRILLDRIIKRVFVCEYVRAFKRTAGKKIENISLFILKMIT